MRILSAVICLAILLIAWAVPANALLYRGSLHEGEARTYVSAEGNVTVAVAIVSGDGRALVSINDESKFLERGDEFATSIAHLRVREILASRSGGLVTFWLSAAAPTSLAPGETLPILLQHANETKPAMLFENDGRRLVAYVV